MHIGNRLKQNNEKFVPEFEKHCKIDYLECKYCGYYDKDKQWCKMYLDELSDLLNKGYKLRK